MVIKTTIKGSFCRLTFLEEGEGTRGPPGEMSHGRFSGQN